MTKDAKKFLVKKTETLSNLEDKTKALDKINELEKRAQQSFIFDIDLKEYVTGSYYEYPHKFERLVIKNAITGDIYDSGIGEINEGFKKGDDGEIYVNCNCSKDYGFDRQDIGEYIVPIDTYFSTFTNYFNLKELQSSQRVSQIQENRRLRNELNKLCE